jgi:serpin B
MRFLLSGLLASALAWSFPMLAQAQKLDPEIATLVQGNNDFALTLYHQIAAKQDGNLFFSPYSVSNALAMTYAGARGNTAEEMKTTLRFNLAADRLPPAFGKLIADLDGDGIGNANGKPRPFQLTVANRLWGQKDYGFLPEFTKIGKDYYRAGLEEVDFVSSAEVARNTINAWVEKQTKDKIKNLIPPRALNETTRLVLTNAIYFKAAWLHQFDPQATMPAPFHLSNGKTIDAPMMRTMRPLPFASHESFLLLQLPYEGNAQSMIVLLPKKKDGLGELEKQLNSETLSKWLQKLSTHEVDVKLPKFKVTAQITLNDILQQMGMKDAFTPGKADFSGMATRESLFISAVLHKAFVDVNEAGTEVAAATAVISSAEVKARPPTPIPFHADHPFLYLIRDNATGSILFAGRLADPAK